MVAVLGINAVFHDPAAAVIVDGNVVAAAEEERFTRRKSRKKPVPFSNWELPELSARWCLERAGLRPADVDVVGYSFDPAMLPEPDADVSANYWEGLRTIYASKAPDFLGRALPGLLRSTVTFVPHHVAHAASAYLCAPFPSSAVLVLDGRGETSSHLSGRAKDGRLDVLACQPLPHSLGWLYENLTEHLGFRRSADEYRVMALAAYGRPRHLDVFREAVRASDDGGFVTEAVDWHRLAPRLPHGGEITEAHADLACSVQRRLEEVVLDLGRWLHEQTGERSLTAAGGVFFNCVANSRLLAEGPFDDVWVQPAAGDAGTAVGAGLYLARQAGDRTGAMHTAALGRDWSDEAIRVLLDQVGLPYERPDDLASATAEVLAENKVVGWFQGRSEFGPRALGHRSLLAHPGDPSNAGRLNDIKGREQFRPLAPIVPAERAREMFGHGPVPSPFMLFVHEVRPEWQDRIPAVLHIDGTARIQTVDRDAEPLLWRLLDRFAGRTGTPVLMNTSFNTGDRPMVDSPRDALECFGSSPIDVLVLGSYLLRRVSA